MLLCEFILNSTRAPPGEEFLYHTLLELHLMGDEEDQATQPASSAATETSAEGAPTPSQTPSHPSAADISSQQTDQVGCPASQLWLHAQLELVRLVNTDVALHAASVQHVRCGDSLVGLQGILTLG